MTNEQPFLPLFFTTEDADLWGKLQKLPAEERSKVTKQALREFFRDHTDLSQTFPEDIRFNEVDNDKETALNQTAEDNELFRFMGKEDTSKDNSFDKGQDTLENEEIEDDQDESPAQVAFSLESLFEISPIEAKPGPVKNLLSIIGEEDDEEVIRLLRRTNENEEE